MPYPRVVQAARDLGLRYPIVQDNDSAIWRRFSTWAWPTAVLVDRKGIVRYSHIGEGAYAETEKVIQQLLAEHEGASGEAGRPPRLRGGHARRGRPRRARLRLAAAVGGLGRAAPARAGARHGRDGRGQDGHDRPQGRGGMPAARCRPCCSTRAPPGQAPSRFDAWPARTPLVERVFLLDRQGRLRYPAELRATTPPCSSPRSSPGGGTSGTAGAAVTSWPAIGWSSPSSCPERHEGPAGRARPQRGVLRREVLERASASCPARASSPSSTGRRPHRVRPRPLAGAERG